MWAPLLRRSAMMPEPPLRSNHQDCDSPRFCTTPHGWQWPRHRAKADCHSPPRKGGNATGINFFAQEVTAKRLGLLHELVPKAVRVAVLLNPTNASSAETTLRVVQE